MPAHYRQIALDEAKPGMVLSDDLLDHHGNVLLVQGCVLTNSMLAALRRHRVTMLPVLGDESSAADQEAERMRHENRLARLFRKPGDAAEDATGLLQQYVHYFRVGASS